MTKKKAKFKRLEDWEIGRVEESGIFIFIATSVNMDNNYLLGIPNIS